MAQTYGIDLSHNNKVISWPQIKANIPAIDYVYIKATQGTTFLDPAAVANAMGAKSQSIPFGFYHFANVGSTDVVNDAKAEAKFFANVLKGLPKGKFAPVLDIEQNPKNLSPASVELWIETFISTMKALGYPKVTLYSYVSFLNQNLPKNHSLGNVPLWVADWSGPLNLPNGWKTYAVRQFTDRGLVAGVDGVVDMSVTDTGLLTAALAAGGLTVAIVIFLVFVFLFIF